MPTEFSIEMLTQIVGSVFETMMSLEVVKSRTPRVPSGDRVTSAVHLAGAWSGAFLLECNTREACRFAGRFLSIDPPDTVDDAVISVLGELANMIGGNMKCVMTPGIVLSMPSIVDGNDLHLYGTEVLERLAFQCAEGDFWVTVLTMPPSSTDS
jgi:CheY-specific phosphatase CheX